MKQTIHYLNVDTRRNLLKPFILGTFEAISSYPRLLIEVFIKRDMGDRYFTLASAITVFAILFYGPHFLPPYRNMAWVSLTGIFWSWYVLLAAFAYFSIRRYFETKRKTAEFDMMYYSKSRGYSISFFHKLFDRFGMQYNPRVKSILFEPAVPFLVGLVLSQTSQALTGGLLMFCAVVYSLSFWSSYASSDGWVQDRIDNMILEGDILDTFRSKTPVPKGVDFYPKMPNSQQLRDEIADDIEEEQQTYAR